MTPKFQDGPRDITWTVSDANLFIDTNRGKEISAIVEHVFNASMVRLYLPSKATYITLSLAGIRAPSQRGSDGAPEAFFELARYTVESKLLGRDLNVIVEGAAPMGSNKERFYIDRAWKISPGKVDDPFLPPTMVKWSFRGTLKETINIH